MSVRVLRWPYPYKWSFGIIDDTDCSTLPAVRAFYEYCIELGIFPTKTVWAHDALRDCGSPQPHPPISGTTLDDPEYLQYCKELSRRGVELCLHDVSPGNNRREETLSGFAKLETEFGYKPRIHVFHSHNSDHIYWGANHYTSSVARALVRLVAGRYTYHGEDPASPYYWSDYCKDNISYIRLYRTRRFNVLRCNPSMPFHLNGKPDVKLWFSASASRFRLHKLDGRGLDALAAQDGAFILYAYAYDLVRPGDKSTVAPEVQHALLSISQRTDCWRSSVSMILDRCLAAKNIVTTVRRNAYILSNPTGVTLDQFQFRAKRNELYLASGQCLRPDDEGRFHIDSLRGGECLALYFSAESAHAGDPGGISRFEVTRMMFEELVHLGAKRWRGIVGRRRRAKKLRA